MSVELNKTINPSVLQTQTQELEICSDGLWNYTEQGKYRVYLSKCFQFTISAVPSVYIFIGLLISLCLHRQTYKTPITRIKFGFLVTTKWICTAGIFVSVLMDICSIAVEDTLNTSDSIDVLHYFSPSLCLLSLIVFVLLSERERRRHQPRSELLFLFTLLLFLCGLPRFWGLWRESGDSEHQSHRHTFSFEIQSIIQRVQLGAISAYLILSFALLLAHCFSPHTTRNSLLTDQNACPKLWASVPSLWTFAWMTGFVWKAFRGRIKRPEDVFSIPPERSVSPNYRLFWTAWVRSIRRHTNPKPKKIAGHTHYIWSDREPLLNEWDDQSLTDQNTGHENHETFRTATNDSDLPVVSFRPKSSGSNGAAPNMDTSPNIKRGTAIDGSPLWLLTQALISAFGRQLFSAWFILFTSTLLTYTRPLLLGLLLRFLSSTDDPAWQGYVIASGIGVVGLICMVFEQRGMYSALTLGVSVRSALTSAIYRKTTRLSAQARADYTTGELVNLISVDVNRIMEFFMYSFFTWTALVQLTLSFYLLWRQLGVATLAGIGCLLLMLPINGGLMWCLQRFESSLMKWKDARMKSLGEVFTAIKIIKLYAWERAFASQVIELRRTELRNLFRVTLCWAGAQLFWCMAPFAILSCTFVTFTRDTLFTSFVPSITNTTVVVPHRPQFLDPERIFVSVSLFNLLREPLIALPWSLSVIVMAFVSLKRIGKFLLAPELDNAAIEKGSNDANDPMAIAFADASFSWTETGPLVLSNLNFSIGRGWLVAVVGTVGSGKSSLLSACLGDLLRRSGTATLKGTTAYVPQTAWIQQQSLRENICFGETLGESPTTREVATGKRAWYEQVLDACELQPDLERLLSGDKTEIGERGVNLSGGQRQRVSLARAVFQNCDIYLMDDPLSAVDSHVGKQLFEKVIGPNGLLKEKTRLITTNAFHWLQQADWLLVLNENGELAQSGTYNDIVQNTSGHFAEYLQSIEKQLHEAKQARRKSMPVVSTLKPGQSTSDDHRRSLGICLGQGNSVTPPSSLRSRFQINGSTRRSSTGRIESISPNIIDVTIEKELEFGDFHETGTRRRSRVTFNQDVIVHMETTQLESNPEEEEDDTWSEDSNLETPGSGERRLSTVSGRFMVDEEVLQGRVSSSAYINYLLDRGWFISLLSILSYSLFLAAQTFGSYWLQWFADDPDLTASEESINNDTIWQNATARGEIISRIKDRTLFYMSGYAWTGLGQLLATLGFLSCHMFASLRASKEMHRNLLTRMLHAPVAFFDRTPLGRILNRFSDDVENVDRIIPDALSEVITCVGDTAICLTVIVIALRPPGLGLVVVLPLVILCGLSQALYLPCSRQVRRMDAVTRSPLLANFGETAASSLGCSVVRAFGRTDAFVANADELIDRNAVHGYVRFASNRWLDVGLTLSNQLMLLLVTCFVVFYRTHMSAGLAGLIVTYALEVAGNFTWLVKELAQFETSAVSLERIYEYSQVEQEASWEDGPDSPPPPDWPAPCCQIRFNRASMTYSLPGSDDCTDELMTVQSTNQLALRSVDLVLSGNPGSRRIGVVGRTGAGKSSLAASIFRLTEATILEEDRATLPEPLATRGPVLVDGIDLARIGLHELRSRFSILPQEPVLFAGTLRFNLDPFGQQPDEKLWAALEASHLASWVKSDGIGLDYECGEGGCNLSAGQRQLVCLARVCLSSGGRVRLLILDEATAAMDPVTDNLVMRTVVGDLFRDATVIIIAHRLDTVVDTDLIVVMDQGRVVETGRPEALLADPQSQFAAMYKAGH